MQQQAFHTLLLQVLFSKAVTKRAVNISPVSTTAYTIFVIVSTNEAIGAKTT